MTLTRKIVLRDAPPLVGTEIAVYISGEATDKHDGFTFVIARTVLPAASEHFTIEWGDGSSEVRYESVSDLSHTYARPGLYRIRLCDAISNVTVSASAGSDNNEIYAPMVREVRVMSSKIHTIARCAFMNAYNLEKVEFRGSKVRTLASSAFYDCRALKSFDGFEEIEKIMMSAFHGCTGLPERIDLPNVVNISAGAIYSPFIGTNIKEFHFAAKNEATIKELQFYKDTGGNLGVEGAVCVFDL